MTKPIITATKYGRREQPQDIIPVVDREHEAARILIAMCQTYPRIYTRHELMRIGGFHRRDGVTEYTSFHWWMLRINDTLPRTGWRINDTSNYRLQSITAEHEVALIRKLGIAA
jgi:hypothetical protein